MEEKLARLTARIPKTLMTKLKVYAAERQEHPGPEKDMVKKGGR